LFSASLGRCMAGRHTLMVVHTATGNVGAVLCETPPDRPASETITDGGVAMILRPNRGRTQDWRMNNKKRRRRIDWRIVARLCGVVSCGGGEIAIWRPVHLY
jgi:hypothetical protein